MADEAIAKRADAASSDRRLGDVKWVDNFMFRFLRVRDEKMGGDNAAMPLIVRAYRSRAIPAFGGEQTPCPLPAGRAHQPVSCNKGKVMSFGGTTD